MPAHRRPLPFLLLALVVACASDGRPEVGIREPEPAAVPAPAITMSTADPSVDLDLPSDTRPPLDRDAPAAFATATFALG